MTLDQVLDYFSKDGKRYGAQSRLARVCNVSPQYISQVVESGKVPFSIQCELEVRTRGELKVDPELLGDECPDCGKKLQ